MPTPAPIPVSREIDISLLVNANPCDRIVLLGSYWPYATHNYESCVVKSFKESHPVEDFQPGIGLLCETYARKILKDLHGESQFRWTVRVLSSSEQKPDTQRPLALLEGFLCGELGLQSLTQVLFRSAPRPPMRTLEPLSGSEALLRRLRYAAQDLFMVPVFAGGAALLIDDIYNTGASMRLYAQVLKQFAGVDRVVGVNLAAMRFKAGRDGHGRLSMDTSEFESRPEFVIRWLDSERVVHSREDCQGIAGRATAKLGFLADRIGVACRLCHPVVRERRFWGLLR